MSWSAQVLLKIKRQTRRTDKPDVTYWQSDLIPLQSENPNDDDSEKLPPITLADLVAIRDALKSLPLAEYIETVVVRSYYRSAALDAIEFKITRVAYTKRNDLTFKLMASNQTLQDVLATLGTNDNRPRYTKQKQDESY